MDDSKVFMFPDGGTRQTSSDANSLLPLLMCNGGFGGGNWVWIIFLFFLYPLMRNGGLFGNMGQNGGGCLGPLANMVNNNDGRDLIMQAINGNGAAVNPIAQAVNEIKCAQPQTVTVPYQPFQAVPNCVAYQYGMYNGGNNLNGFWF